MMKSILQKIAPTIGAALGLSVMLANPVQAAVFSFSFGGAYGSNGILSFDDNSLTGAKNEVVSLSELVNPSFYFLLIPYPFLPNNNRPIYAFDSPSSQPTFTFTAGELTGIYFQAGPEPFLVYGSSPPFFYYSSEGTASLEAAGQKYTITEDVVQSSVNYSTSPPTFFSQRVSNSFGGPILIQTIQPWVPTQSVPEPSSAFGLGLLGIGFLLKKKLEAAKSA